MNELDYGACQTEGDERFEYVCISEQRSDGLLLGRQHK